MLQAGSKFIPYIVVCVAIFSFAGQTFAQDVPKAKLGTKVTQKFNKMRQDAATSAKKAINSPLNQLDKVEKAMSKSEKKPAIRDKWALFVSCDKYFDKDIPPVKSAGESALALKEMFLNPQFGRFAPAHVASVSGTKSIKSNIDKCLGEPWLLTKALPGDLIVLYFNTLYKTVPGKNDLYLCFYDTPSNKENLENTISLKEMLKETARRSLSKYIVCLLDISPLEPGDSGSAPPSRMYDEIAQETNTTILASTTPGSESMHALTKNCSAFVDNLAEALKSGGGQADLVAIAQYIQQNEGTQKAIFAYPRNDSLIVKAVLGMPTKSSTPAEHIRIGHNASGVYMASRQSQDATAQASKAPPQTKEDDDDDNDENDNSGQAVDFGSYMTKMKKDIQSKWHPPKGFDAHRVVTVFTIHRDGKITEPQIVESSGKDDIDKMALEALRQASPLDPLPKGCPRSVQLRYKFDWSVH